MYAGKHQKGLTFISWLIILAVGGFFVMLTLKLVPIYLENQSIQSVVESLDNDPLVRRETAGGIKKIIKKRMRINSVYDFPAEWVKVKKSKNRLIVDITYERREPIVANVSVVVSFSEKLDTMLIPGN